jgi:SAM-dependent methyltransferase
MPENDDSNPFESTEEYYARYRPDYGDAAIEYLVERFGLDDSARVLDLGCGAGQIAVPLAAYVGEVVGMDPNEQMLRMARQRAETAGRENVEWMVGSDSDLVEREDLGTFQLTTMGRSFHWMDQRETLDRLRSMTEPGGGVAILNDAEWITRGGKEWQAAVYAIADEYLDDLPERVGSTEVEYDDPWDEMLDERGFADVAVERIEFERMWDVDSIVGYVFSLSFCSPEAFGVDKDAFETDLCAHLDERGRETFGQDVAVEVISGRM